MMNLLKKKEKRALEWLYEQYSPLIYGTIRRIGKTDEVTEDLLARTYIRAWSCAETIDVARDRALPWLFNILLDTVADYAEKAGHALKPAEVGALKLELDADQLAYEERLVRLERILMDHLDNSRLHIGGERLSDTKLQQSVLAIRARLKINRVLMPR